MKIFNYKLLGEILKCQANFYDNILTQLRPEPEYFRVGFYGLGFPLFVRVSVKKRKNLDRKIARNPSFLLRKNVLSFSRKKKIIIYINIYLYLSYSSSIILIS